VSFILALRIGLSLLLALPCAAIPRLAQRLSNWWLLTGLGIGLLLGILGSALSVAPYPWTDVVVLLVALTGGLLLGRVVPTRFWPILLVMVLLSAVDVANIVRTYRASAAPANFSGPDLYGNLLFLLPFGAVNVGIGDLLLLTALAEQWRRRGSSWLVVFTPGAVGLGLAYAFVLVTGLAVIPLLPFLTVGWGCSGILQHLHRRNEMSSG